MKHVLMVLALSMGAGRSCAVALAVPSGATEEKNEVCQIRHYAEIDVYQIHFTDPGFWKDGKEFPWIEKAHCKDDYFTAQFTQQLLAGHPNTFDAGADCSRGCSLDVFAYKAAQAALRLLFVRHPATSETFGALAGEALAEALKEGVCCVVRSGAAEPFAYALEWRVPNWCPAGYPQYGVHPAPEIATEVGKCPERKLAPADAEWQAAQNALKAVYPNVAAQPLPGANRARSKGKGGVRSMRRLVRWAVRQLMAALRI